MLLNTYFTQKEPAIGPAETLSISVQELDRSARITIVNKSRKVPLAFSRFPTYWEVGYQASNGSTRWESAAGDANWGIPRKSSWIVLWPEETVSFRILRFRQRAVGERLLARYRIDRSDPNASEIGKDVSARIVRNAISN